MSQFEDFVNLELPRRPVMFTQELTGYDGDPNSAPQPLLQNSPKGTYFLQATGPVLWLKTDPAPGTWIQVTGGGSPPTPTGVASSLQSTVNWVCPETAVVGDVMQVTGDHTADFAQANAEATMPAYGLIARKPTATTCILAFMGEVAGFSGLVPDQTYYVSDTAPGKLTPTAPTNAGTVLQRIGVAVTSTIIWVDVDVNDFYVQ